MILAPGSLALLTLALAVGAIALARQGRVARAARIWIALWVAIYFLLSLPVVSRQLYEGLAGRRQPFTAERDRRPRAVVVLSSGVQSYRLGDTVVRVLPVATTLRVLEAARVYRLLDSPIVIVSGSGPEGERSPVVPAMRDALIAAGVPGDRIVIESDSRDTYQASRAIGALLQAHRLSVAVLVTSAQHMPRALRVFQAAGMDVVPAPAPVLRARPAGGWRAVVPDTSALALSELCLHEYVGVFYYALRGWA